MEETESRNDSYTEVADGEKPISALDLYENAITKTGYGRYQVLLLFFCGLGMISDSVELFSVSFVLPPATCDLNLTSADKGWINSSMFLGMMVGGYLWGVISDARGRRSTLIWSLTINGVAGLGASFTQSIWSFTLLRFLSGIGVGGSLPLFYTYYGEYQPKDRRGAMISVLAFFWPLGIVLAAGLAWIVIPQSIGIVRPGFIYDSWRVYLSLCSIPAFAGAIATWFMPESPKFLMKQGKVKEAVTILSRMYKANHPKEEDKSVYQIFELEGSCGRKPFEADETKVSKCQEFKDALKEAYETTVQLFRPPLTSTTLTFAAVFFGLCFGYYGLFLWFPELFKRVQIYGGTPCRPDGFNFSQSDGVYTLCPFDRSDTTIYFNTFLSSLCAVIGNVLVIFCVEKIGRRIICGTSLVLCGASVFMIYGITAPNGTLILSCIFSAISRCAFVCADILEVELFPTNLRATGAGFVCSVGRVGAILGNVVFGQLVDVNCAVPLTLVAAVMSLAGLLCIKLPESTKTDIH